MEIVILEKICRQLRLGELTEQPRPLSGGFLHKMYSLFTTQGRYAVKLLNSYIMKRETAAENFRNAEMLESMLETQAIPILSALKFGGKKMQELDGQYFYLFPWFEGKALQSDEVTVFHCRTVGESLAKLHVVDRREKPFVQDEMCIDWDLYIARLAEKNAELHELLRENRDLLYEMQEAANAAIPKMPAVETICHNDMDCKNVLWNGDQMRIIDLECLSYGSPFLEFYETALCWSGYENCAVDFGLLREFVNAYAASGGQLAADWGVIHDCNVGRLGWLAYNVQRALGIECSEEEMELGAAEVRATMPKVVYYHEMREEIGACLKG